MKLLAKAVFSYHSCNRRMRAAWRGLKVAADKRLSPASARAYGKVERLVWKRLQRDKARGQRLKWRRRWGRLRADCHAESRLQCWFAHELRDRVRQRSAYSLWNMTQTHIHKLSDLCALVWPLCFCGSFCSLWSIVSVKFGL